MGRFSGIEIPVNPMIVEMELGDRALVFRPVPKPAGEPKPKRSKRGKLDIYFILENYELGMLQRIV